MKKKKAPKFMEREAIVLTQELKDACEARVKEIFELAKSLWKIKYKLPEIHYDLKSLTCGMAHYSLNKIRLHPIFLVENETDYIVETIPHEVAHLLVPLVGPILRKKNPALGDGPFRGHGQEWRMVMEALGRGPKPGQTWKDVIKHKYDPSSIPITPRKKLGPRQPGGRKVGEIILRIESLKPEELAALRERLGLEIPSPEVLKEAHELTRLLYSFPDNVGTSKSTAGWAKNVINELAQSPRRK